MEQFYTPQEIAKMLKVNPRSVHRWLREGKLKGFKVGGDLWRIPESELKAFIEESQKDNP